MVLKEKNKHIIAIIGATASGKTRFALDFAQVIISGKQRSLHKVDSIISKLNLELSPEKDAKRSQKNFEYVGVDIVSVDSRQVYKGLEVLSGADIPDDFEKIQVHEPYEFPYFKHKNEYITIHGVSIMELNEEWSVSHFKSFASKIIVSSWEHNRLPILVGGTGLYHQQLFSEDSNLFISPNKEVRNTAHSMSITQLQDWLDGIDSGKLKSMNNSDRNNPRRLVRAIEVLLAQSDENEKKSVSLPGHYKLITIGIKTDLTEVQKKIKRRVEERFSVGAVTEVQNLSKLCENQELPVCSTLGVSDISKYLKNETTQEECLHNWSLHEFQYAKRQITWFKKMQDIFWV